MSRRTLIIGNPRAGGDRAAARLDRWLSILRESGVRADHVLTTRAREATELARAAADDYDVIAGLGGDGTANEVANGILASGSSRAALAVVPFGTGNDVARMLHVPNAESAIQAIKDAVVRRIDVIEVSHQQDGEPARFHALLYAAVGIAGEMGRKTTLSVKQLFGERYAYTVGFLRALFSFQAPRMRVRCGEAELDEPLVLVAVGNAEVAGAGALRLCPGASVTDGILNINVATAMNRREIARCFLQVRKGIHPGHPRIRYFPGTYLEVDSEPPMEIQFDGELFGSTPATFRVKPGALKVVTGPGFEK